MATITVINLNDNGPGSLRDAIANANSGDTINFAAGLSSDTLFLTNGELDINKNLTINGDIDGNGTPDITIDAGGASRVFDIQSGTSGSRITTTLNGLVMENGSVSGANGGGIATGNYDALTVSNSRLTGNGASDLAGVSTGNGGAIFVDTLSSLTLLNTALDHNNADTAGGGIYANYAFVAIVNSTLSDNSALEGGGIDLNLGTVTLVNTTLSGNSAPQGGGINNDGTLTLVNTTLVGNSAGQGGGINNDGTAKLYDSTLTGNYASGQNGGIESDLNSLTLSNSIVAGNNSPTNDDVGGTSTTIHFDGNNILGSSPTVALGGGIDTSQGTYTQINGRDQTALETVFGAVGPNPDTGVLSGLAAKNGGPVRTVAINASGIAYNAGVNGALPPDTFDINHNGDTSEPLPLDARGFTRVAGATVDIGAFEQQSNGPFIVTTLADEPYDGGTVAQETADGTGLSLREALTLANYSGGPSTITFAPDLAGGTIHLANGELDITSDGITIDGDIDGNGTPDITIDAGYASRVFDVDNGVSAISATIDGLVISRGYTVPAGPADNGGGIAVGQSDTLALNNSKVVDNLGYAGGGIYGGQGSTISLTNTSLFGNRSYHAGGAIAVGANATLTLTNATVAGNYGGTAGGGIDLAGNATATLINATIAGNYGGGHGGSGNGGGINGEGSNVIKLYNSTFTGNYAYTSGGGIYSNGGAGASVTLANSIVAGNSAYDSGTDLDLNNSPLVLKGNSILGSTPANASSIDTTNGAYTQIDGTNQSALASVFERVGQNPSTGVLSGVLADNGGLVRTVAINPGGIAYNAGSNAALPPDASDLNNNGNTAEPLPVDARGFARVTGGMTDIGAFEQQPGNLFVVTTLADETYDGGTLAQETADGTGLSLREALGLANKDPNSIDTILFDPSLIGGSTHGVNDGALLLTNGQLTVNGNVTIEGDVNADGTPDITIDGQGASRDLSVLGGNVTLDGLTITGGYAHVHGGGVSLGTGAYGPAIVTISHSVITNNQAAYGGGISINYGDALALSNSVISGNSALYVGGGIANEGALQMRDTTVSGNSSGYLGGGIASQGVLLAVNTTISNNQVTHSTGGTYPSAGAGLYNSGYAALANSTISGNKGAYAGGGIYNSELLQLTNVTIANNSAYNGGGLYNATCGCGIAAVYNTTFTGNYADKFGGGIANGGGNVTLVNSLVAGNRAGYQGSDVATASGATSYAGVDLFSQSGIGRPGIDITQPDLTQIFANTGIVDPDGVPNSGDEFEAGALTNNGGPVLTVRIRVGGSAQDTGSTSDLPPDFFDLNNNGDTGEPLPVDARGVPRVFGPAVDIGALEIQGPVLTNVPASANYTEHAPPVELSAAFGNANALTVTDADVAELTGATIAITTGALATDVLSADTAGTNVSASYDAASGTLTLTGADTLADYSQVLDSVTFSSPGAHPDNFGLDPTRTVTWSVTDIAGVTSAPATTTIAITATASVPFDLNGDAVSDLVFQNKGAPQIWLWNGTSVTSQATFANPGASWHVITSRDLNGDGNADLIWQNSDGTPGIWLMNGTTPIAEVGLTNPGPAWNLVGSGDFNDDGRADLLWQDVSGNVGIWEMNGTTPIAQAAIGSPGPNWKVIGAADFNADGRDDILLQNTATGNLMIDLMNGTSITSSVSITVGDPSWHAVSVGEFNGQAEIAWQNSNGTPGLWLMNGTAPAAEVGLPNAGAGWQLVSIDHFTPNGQADLLFQNTSGAMGMWETNGASIAAAFNLPNPGAGWQSVNGHPFAG